MSKNKYPFAIGDNTQTLTETTQTVVVLNQVVSSNTVTVINGGTSNVINNTVINNISNKVTGSLEVDGDLFVNGSVHIRPTDPNKPTLILSGAVEIVDALFSNKVPEIVKPSLKIGNLGILGENKKEDDIKILDLGDFC
jgi:hypothetical protein